MKVSWAKFFFGFVICYFTVKVCLAGPSNYVNYQATLVTSSGLPLGEGHVDFRVTILDPSRKCALYVEDHSKVSMAGAKGFTSLTIGGGNRNFPTSGVAVKMSDIFNNLSGELKCQGGGIYLPGANDERRIVVQYNDGTGWLTAPQVAIHSVPYALFAGNSETLGGFPASEYLQKKLMPSCGITEALRFDGAGFSCVSVVNPKLGVMDVVSISSANSDIVVDNGTSTAVLTLNSGTGPDQIVKLTAAGKYPAVDGSLITNINLSGSVGTSTLAISNGGTNSTATLSNNRVMVSSGGAIVEASALTSGQVLIGVTGGAPVPHTLTPGNGMLITNAAGSIIPAVDAGLGANKIPQLGGVAAAPNSILMANGTGTALIGQTCSVNEILKWNGSNWACAIDGGVGSGTGTVTSVTSSTSDIVVSDTTSTPVMTLNSGTGANQIVKLTSAGKYPAVDGSLITNINWAAAVGTSTLPIANGGTNSSTALNNNRLMRSISGAIVEAPALTNGQLFIGSTGAAPVATNLTAGNGVLITNGSGSITAAVDGGLGVSKFPQVGGVALAANSLLMANGTGTALVGQTCSVDEILKWNGTNWACAILPTSSGSSQWNTSGSSINYTAGFVGIGTTTPVSALHVQGSITVRDPGGSNPDVNVLDLNGNRSIRLANSSDSHGRLEIYSAGNVTTYLQGAGHSYLNGGNIGIGTTTPAKKLHIYDSSDSGMVIERTDISGRYFFLRYNGTTADLGSNGSDGVAIYTDDTERMRVVESTGNVGIGITSPTHILHINGQGRSTNSSWATSSDAHLKDLQGKFNYGLDAISKINTVWFNYKKDNPLSLPSDKKFSGVIAQELQKIIPEAVELMPDGFLTVNADLVHWASVNAIRELNEKNKLSEIKISQQQLQLQQQEQNLNELKARLSRLEKMISK